MPKVEGEQTHGPTLTAAVAVLHKRKRMYAGLYFWTGRATDNNGNDNARIVNLNDGNSDLNNVGNDNHVLCVRP